MNIKLFLMRAFFTAILFFAGAFNVPGQYDIILDSDSARLFDGLGQYFVSPGQADKTTGIGGEATFRIVKVTNIQGNNPFNPVQPVFNFGGVYLSNVDDLIGCVRGDACTGSGGAFTCSPMTVQNNLVFSALCMRSASSCGVYVATTGGCPAGAEAIWAWYCSINKLSLQGRNGYVLSEIQPNASTGPGGSYINLASGQRYTVKMSKAGKYWRVSFSLTLNPGNTSTFSVYGITSLQR